MDTPDAAVLFESHPERLMVDDGVRVLATHYSISWIQAYAGKLLLCSVIQPFISTMVRLACEHADAKGATLFVVDGLVLRPLIIYNLPKEYIEGIGTVRVGEQCCGRAVAHKKPWIVSDMLTDPLFAEGRQGAVSSPIRAGFSVPVLDGDEAIASLACHFDVPHTPTTLDIERNQVFAKLIAISLKGINLSVIPPIFVPRLEPSVSAAAD